MSARQIIDARKRLLRQRIEAQRSTLQGQVEGFRRPLQAFELARRGGEVVRRHATASALIAATAGVVLMRGGVLSKTLRLVQLANTTTRWWVIGRVAMQLARRWGPAPATSTP